MTEHPCALQVPFSRMAAAHHATPVLLERWCRDLADALRLQLNPTFAAEKEAVAAVFREMDMDSSGDLKMEEVRAFLAQKNMSFTEFQMAEVFALLDLNRDGRVSLEEFEHHLGIRELPMQIVKHVVADEEQLALEEAILEADEKMHEEVEELFDAIDTDRCVSVLFCIFLVLSI